jgi:hypothetical protein
MTPALLIFQISLSFVVAGVLTLRRRVSAPAPVRVADDDDPRLRPR